MAHRFIMTDFDDFQSAPTMAATTTTRAPAQTTQAPAPRKNNLLDLLGDDAFSPSPAASNFTSPTMASQPSLLDQHGSGHTASGTLSPSGSRPMTPNNPLTATASSSSSLGSFSSAPNNKKPDLPGGMWSQASAFVSLDSLGKGSNVSKPSAGPSMNAMKSSSVNAGWNTWASANSSPSPTPQQKPALSTPKSPFDDLLS